MRDSQPRMAGKLTFEERFEEIRVLKVDDWGCVVEARDREKNTVTLVRRLETERRRRPLAVAALKAEADYTTALDDPHSPRALLAKLEGRESVVIYEGVGGIRLDRLFESLDLAGFTFTPHGALALVYDVVRAAVAVQQTRPPTAAERTTWGHGEITPTNILVGASGSGRLFNATFAVAGVREADPPSLSRLSAAPEVESDPRATSGPADVHAIGAILAVAVFGEGAVFAAASGGRLCETIDRLIAARGRHFDPVFAELLSRALDRDPAKRFENPASMFAAMRACGSAEDLRPGIARMAEVAAQGGEGVADLAREFPALIVHTSDGVANGSRDAVTGTGEVPDDFAAGLDDQTRSEDAESVAAGLQAELQRAIAAAAMAPPQDFALPRREAVAIAADFAREDAEEKTEVGEAGDLLPPLPSLPAAPRPPENVSGAFRAVFNTGEFEVVKTPSAMAALDARAIAADVARMVAAADAKLEAILGKPSDLADAPPPAHIEPESVSGAFRAIFKTGEHAQPDPAKTIQFQMDVPPEAVPEPPVEEDDRGKTMQFQLPIPAEAFRPPAEDRASTIAGPLAFDEEPTRAATEDDAPPAPRPRAPSIAINLPVDPEARLDDGAEQSWSESREKPATVEKPFFAGSIELIDRGAPPPREDTVRTEIEDIPPAQSILQQEMPPPSAFMREETTKTPSDVVLQSMAPPSFAQPELTHTPSDAMPLPGRIAPPRMPSSIFEEREPSHPGLEGAEPLVARHEPTPPPRLIPAPVRFDLRSSPGLAPPPLPPAPPPPAAMPTPAPPRLVPTASAPAPAPLPVTIERVRPPPSIAGERPVWTPPDRRVPSKVETAPIPEPPANDTSLRPMALRIAAAAIAAGAFGFALFFLTTDDFELTNVGSGIGAPQPRQERLAQASPPAPASPAPRAPAAPADRPSVIIRDKPEPRGEYLLGVDGFADRSSPGAGTRRSSRPRVEPAAADEVRTAFAEDDFSSDYRDRVFFGTEDVAVPEFKESWVKDLTPADEIPTVPTQLVVNVIPWGRVYVDGQDYGYPPVLVSAIEPGVHDVRVERAGFKTVRRTVVAKEGRRQMIHIRFSE